MTINLSGHWHYNEETARHCVRLVINGETADGSTEILPSAALTIASWWQAPSGTGYILAGFASGATVSREALLDDIHSTRMTEGYFGPSGEAFTRGHMSEEDRQALDCLSTFVINYSDTEV